MISVDALLEFAVLEASAYEQRQLPPLNDLNQLYPASDFLKQKSTKSTQMKNVVKNYLCLKNLENGSLHL